MKTSNAIFMAVVTLFVGMGIGGIAAGTSLANASLELCSSAAVVASGSFHSNCSYSADRRFVLTIPENVTVTDAEARKGLPEVPPMRSFDLETMEIINE